MIATIGRLQQLSASQISFENVQQVVFDEGDKLLAGDMTDDLIKIMTNKTMPSSHNENILMFSATEIMDLSVLPKKLLQECKVLKIGKAGSGGACHDIQQIVIEVNGCNRREKLEQLLTENNVSGTIVFVKDVGTADCLSAYLWERNINATILHADRPKAQRHQSLEEFRIGARDILVVTPVVRLYIKRTT